MAEESIDVRVRLRGARKAAAEAHQVARGVDEIGDQAAQADRKIDGFSVASLAGSTAVLELGNAATSAAGGIGGGGAGGGGGLLDILGQVGGAARGAQPALLALAVVLGSYLVVGLAAVIASAALAVAGIAALGVAAGGAFAVALGIGAVAMQRFKQQSDQAGTAAYRLQRAAGRTGDTLIKAFGPGIDRIFEGLTKALRIVRPLLASLGGPVEKLGAAFQKGIGTFAREVAALGPDIRKFIRGLAPLIRAAFKAAGPLLGIFLNLANAALPHLVRLARSFSVWLGKAFKGTGGAEFQTFVRTLIVHLRVWLALATAVARIFLGFIRALAPTGAGIVRWLTQGANALARWVNSASGQRQIKQVMAEMLPLIRQIVVFFIRLVPIVIALMRVMIPGLRIVFGILNPVLSVIGWILNKMIALRNWAASKLPSLSSVIRGVGAAWDAVKSAFSAVWNFIRPKVQWLIDSLKKVTDAVGGVASAGGLRGKAGDVLPPGAIRHGQITGHLPHKALGGIQSGAGSWISGEAGAELNTLLHGRVTVQPLGPSQRISTAGGGRGGGDIVVPVTVLTADGDVLGRTVARSKRKAENAT